MRTGHERRGSVCTWSEPGSGYSTQRARRFKSGNSAVISRASRAGSSCKCWVSCCSVTLAADVGWMWMGHGRVVCGYDRPCLALFDEFHAVFRFITARPMSVSGGDSLGVWVRACADWRGECVFCDMCQRVTLLCCVPHTGVPRPIINAFNRPSWLGGESRNRFSFFLKV